MARLAFSLILYVTLARWLHAELELLTPSLVPVIDSGVDSLSIPTHDKWEPIFNGFIQEYHTLMRTRGDPYHEAQNTREYPEVRTFTPYHQSSQTPQVQW
jgi:hypothetical protein